jgi:hypothetical protein
MSKAWARSWRGTDWEKHWAHWVHYSATSWERVSKFRYLGRILSQDDHDLSACVRNLQRAKAKWAAVSKVLEREGASKKSFARFCLVIVNTVLLYGSDTWLSLDVWRPCSLLFTTDDSGTLREGKFVVSIPRTIFGLDGRWLELWRKPCC